MTVSLQAWRQRQELTQTAAATLLGVSQPYFSLLEKGLRPLTPELRERWREAAGKSQNRSELQESRLRAELRTLGYPPFAHLAPVSRKPQPDVLILRAIAQPDLDARLAEAMPWVVRQFAQQLDTKWLVSQAKLKNLQNRLGFLLQTSGASETEPIFTALQELEPARLLQEATFCWDSMPAATRAWIRNRRTAVAAHWNVVSTLGLETFASTDGSQ